MKWLTDEVPIVRLSILGATGHGKTTLAAAITKVFSEYGQSEFVRYADIYGRFPCRCLYGDLTAHVVVKTAARFYTFSVNRNRVAYLNDVLRSGHTDGAILVISVADGITDATREQVRLSRASGWPAFVIYISKIDKSADPDLLSVVELEAQSLLEEYGYFNCPIVRGCAEWALNGVRNDIAAPSIHALIDVCDGAFTPSTPDSDKPFLMPVEDAMTIIGRGAVATGRVERGVLKAGELVEIVGKRDEIQTTVARSIESIRQLRDSAQIGENVGILLQGIERKDVERGQVIAKPGTITAKTKFEAEVYILSKEEGGRHTPRLISEPVDFYIRTSNFPGRIQTPDKWALVEPGELLHVVVHLTIPAPLERYQRFALHEGGKTVGMGIVTAILE